MPKAAQPRVGLGGCSPRKSVLNLGVSEMQFPAFLQDIFNKLICRKNTGTVVFLIDVCPSRIMK